MKLVKLYCSDSRFRTIRFNDGLNVVLGKVRRRNDTHKDSHNLGKSTLVELLDFMFLKKVDKDYFLRRYKPKFLHHKFYLEIELNNRTYLTICRGASNDTKIAFKSSQADITCNEQTKWDEENLPIERSIAYLNEKLHFDVLPEWSYRKTLSFFLRTQQDYHDVFQLSKFTAGSHKDWKPMVFDLLGYDGDVLTKKYEQEQQLADLQKLAKSIAAETAVDAAEYDKVHSALELKKQERERVGTEIDAFNFYSEERSINKSLVENIERSIADLNSREYTLSYELDGMKQALANIPTFDIGQLKELYQEVNVYFPQNIVRSYADLLEFNVKVTKERNKYLNEQIERIEGELKEIRKQLHEFDDERNRALSTLQNQDTFHKFKTYQAKLAALEGDIARLEMQLKTMDQVSVIAEKVDALKNDIKESTKEVQIQVRQKVGEVSTSIKGKFNELFSDVFNVSALLYVSINTNGNVDFNADVAPSDDEEATAESLGNTYKKMLCAAFDLAVLATYSSKSFYQFVYHDGILEGLDNRKKQLFIDVVKRYCDTYGIQYIFSTIEDDLPNDILNSLQLDEICLELNDEDDKGKLFGFSY